MDRLQALLTDMIRSALSWEVSHGKPAQHFDPDELTHSLRPLTMPSSPINQGGNGHERRNDRQRL